MFFFASIGFTHSHYIPHKLIDIDKSRSPGWHAKNVYAYFLQIQSVWSRRSLYAGDCGFRNSYSMRFVLCIPRPKYYYILFIFKLIAACLRHYRPIGHTFRISNVSSSFFRFASIRLANDPDAKSRSIAYYTT